MKQRQALAQPLEPSPIRQQIKRLVENMDQQIDQMQHLTPAQRSGYIVSRNLVSQAITEWGYANRRLKKQERQERKREINNESYSNDQHRLASESASQEVKPKRTEAQAVSKR